MDIPPEVPSRPHSIVVTTAQKSTEPPPLRGWMARHGRYPKGTVLPETRVQVCPRKRVADLLKLIPKRWYERNLEQNQNVALCCRHPEHHTIAAFKSHPDEQRPDIYIFYCNGVDEQGRVHHTETRRHVRFFVGETDVEGEGRPEWK